MRHKNPGVRVIDQLVLGAEAGGLQQAQFHGGSHRAQLPMPMASSCCPCPVERPAYPRSIPDLFWACTALETQA